MSSAQLDGNTKIKSGTLKVDGSPSDYASSEGISAYRTNTVANGLNENDTNILDFEYLFPINDQSGASITGSVNTKGQYAPLSVQMQIGIISCMPMKRLNMVVMTLVKDVKKL